MEENGHLPSPHPIESQERLELQPTNSFAVLLAMMSQEVCEEIVTQVVFEETESRVVCRCYPFLKNEDQPS